MRIRIGRKIYEFGTLIAGEGENNQDLWDAGLEVGLGHIFGIKYLIWQKRPLIKNETK